MGIRMFDGSVAIITGAASGIGRALATQLSLAGSNVILADRQFDMAEKLAGDICDRGGSASAAELEVRNFADLQRLVNKTFEAKGRLDFMFNNAGIGIGGEINRHTHEDWDRIIDVNVKGVAYGVQAALGPMMAQGFGHIVNTASVSGLIASPGMVAYCTTKHAVVGLSKSLRGEVAGAGIRVSALCPGAVETPLLTGGRFGRFHGVSDTVVRHILTPFAPMDPDWFAKKALKGIKKNNALIILPWQFKVVVAMLRCLPPSWQIRLAAGHVRKRRKQAEAKQENSGADCRWSAGTAPVQSVSDVESAAEN